MKFYNTNFLDIIFNHSTSLIELSRIKTSNRNNQSYEFIDTSVKLIEGITIKIGDVLYMNVSLHQESEDGKTLFYKFDSSMDYTKFIKNDINLNSIIFIYEEKEPWFNIRIDNDIRLRVDPMFSKINPSSQYENIVYIPKNKNDIRDFLKEEGGYSYVDLDSKKFFAILLKNVKYEYLGLVGLNTEIRISYETHYIISDYNMRFLKINTLVL